MELLRRHDVVLEGAEAVVVGRSDLVGKPIGAMLLAANATVTTCHSRTRDLAGVCRRADVLIAAVGVPEMIKGDWIKEGAVVIDVGMNRTPEKLTGDVEFETAVERASLITPGARRRRPDDDRDAAAQHPRRGEGRGRLAMRRAEPVAGLGGIATIAGVLLSDGVGVTGVAADRARPAGARGAGRSRSPRAVPRSRSATAVLASAFGWIGDRAGADPRARRRLVRRRLARAGGRGAGVGRAAG